jgi:alpha-glucosidase (family GH31 glycosyl hydrolase)
MRPLFHDFADTPRLPLARIADQFLMGPCLMHAPILSTTETQRKVALPDANWFDAGNGQWIKGGRTISAKPAVDGTPIYVRDGSIVPMRREEPEDNRTDLTEVDFHIFLSPRFKGEAQTSYTADDGASFDYRKGVVTAFTISARAARDRLELTIDNVAAGYKPCRARFISYRKFKNVVLTVHNSSRRCETKADSWTFAGKRLKTFVTPEMVIG